MAIEAKCKTCGKTFKVVPSQLKRNKGKYCSRNCYILTRRKVVVREEPPSKEELIHLYWRKKLTAEEIGEKFGLRESSVRYWMEKYTIPRREGGYSKGHTPWNKGSPPPAGLSKKQLERLYNEEKLSQRQIAENFGVSRKVISRWMEKWGITARKRSQALKIVWEQRMQQRIPVNLQKMYLEEGYTAKQIARKLGVAKGTVLNWLRRENIPVRPPTPRPSKLKKLWNNPKWKSERVKSVIKGLHRRPTQPEKKLISIIHKYELPLEYTGDSQVIISGRNPDFVTKRGPTKVVEVFGVYWHSPLYPPALEQNTRTAQATIKDYEKRGVPCLIIWEDEISREQHIVEKISSFLG